MSKNEINIPLYRAKKIDDCDNYVEGYYAPNFFMCIGDKVCNTINTKDGKQYEIDISTLVISFDNGETWFSIESASLIMNSNEIIGTQE